MAGITNIFKEAFFSLCLREKRKGKINTFFSIRNMKMKPILPSLKAKKRYIAFEVISKKPIVKFSAVANAVWKASLSFMGELGVSSAALWLLPDMWNEKKQRGIVRVSNKKVNEMKASLTFIKKIGRQNVIVRSVGISGMLNKAYKRFVL